MVAVRLTLVATLFLISVITLYPSLLNSLKRTKNITGNVLVLFLLSFVLILSVYLYGLSVIPYTILSTLIVLSLILILKVNRKYLYSLIYLFFLATSALLIFGMGRAGETSAHILFVLLLLAVIKDFLVRENNV